MIYLLYLCMDVCPWHVFIYLLFILVTFLLSNWACVDELWWVMVHWLIVNQQWTKFILKV